MVTETRKLTDAEAAALEREVGFVVCLIEPAKAHTLARAMEIAADLAAQSGYPVGVFKLYALAEPQKQAVKAEALPSAPVVQKVRDAMAGVR